MFASTNRKMLAAVLAAVVGVGGCAGCADRSTSTPAVQGEAAPGPDSPAEAGQDPVPGSSPNPPAGPDAPVDAALVDAPAPPPGAASVVTFLAFGDPQYGGGPSDKNSFHIQALNQAADLVWPDGVGFSAGGKRVGEPRGVIIAGDLTQNGQAGKDPLDEWFTADRYAFDLNQAYGVEVAEPRVAAELGLFLRDYGLRGNDGLEAFKLRWPVFEGYGNHDFDPLERPASPYAGRAPAREVVSIRNKVRAGWPEARRFAPGTAGHYSWDWDRAHFVHVNLFAGDGAAADGAQQPRDPAGALTFLREDLATVVGTSCRPVFLIMHYGFDPFSREPRWWNDEQRAALLAVLEPYNVVAILHGHVHETRAYAETAPGGKRYDLFSLGSPYYQGQPTNGGRGHFALFRLEGDRLEAADLSWLPANPDPRDGDGADLWTGRKVADLRFQLTTIFAEGWGGWSFARQIDAACPGR